MKLLLLCLVLCVAALNDKHALAQNIVVDDLQKQPQSPLQEQPRALQKQPRALQVNPQQSYMLHCQGCHLADGSGLPGSVPPMRNFLGKFLAVPGGREYLVQVPGSAQSSLNDAELASLLNWLLPEMSAQELPPDFQPYSVMEVKQLRAQPLLDIPTTRATLVSGFPNPETN